MRCIATWAFFLNPVVSFNTNYIMGHVLLDLYYSVLFCRSLFVHLSFIIWSLYCMSNFQNVLVSYDFYTAVIYVTIHNILLVSSDHSIVTILATMISMNLVENVNGLNMKRRNIWMTVNTENWNVQNMHTGLCSTFDNIWLTLSSNSKNQ